MNSKLTPTEFPGEEFTDELQPGTKLLHGQYVIEQFLNSGGFGITYLAKDSLERLVVIKECFPEAICRRKGSTVGVRSRTHATAFRKVVELFIEEARNLARLSHPNIVGVHQVFEDNETAYMALDFVEGRDLLEIVESSKSFSPEALEKILIKLLDAIEFIHGEGILHRDISPDNILLSTGNEPVLIDFGAARETVSRATRYLGAMNTVKDGYSPQEFYITDADQYPSSDLYSLGASLYHVITRHVPPNAQERLSAIASGDEDPYIPLAGQVEGFSDEFLSSIDRVLDVFPKNRIQSAAEWRGILTHSNVSLITRGSVSRPMLAVDNGNVIKPFEDMQPKMPTRGRNRRTKDNPTKGMIAQRRPTTNPRQPKPAAIAAETPAQKARSEQTQSVEDKVLTATLRPPANNNTLKLGAAAAAILALVGVGGYVMLGSDDSDLSTDVVATLPADAIPADTQTAETPTSAPTDAVANDIATQERPAEAASDPAVSISPEVQVAREGLQRTTAPLPDPEELALADALPIIGPDLQSQGTTPAPKPRPGNLTASTAPDDGAQASELPLISDVAPYDLADLDVLIEAPAEVAEVTGSIAISPRNDTDPPRELALVAPAPATGIFPTLSTEAPEPLPATPETTDVIDMSSVITGKAIEFPVLTDDDDPTVVLSVEGRTAELLKPGFKILSTNGIPVDSLNEIRRVVNSTSNYDVGDEVQVTLGIEDPSTGNTFVRSINLPAVQETLLLNGVRFQTRKDGESWITTVASGMGTGQSDLQTGDRIIAFMPTNELVDSQDDLARILRREIQNGNTQFNFAVNRDDEMWFATLRYAVSGN